MICSMAMEEFKSRFFSNRTFFYSYNIKMALINKAKMYKQNITLSVGLFL